MQKNKRNKMTRRYKYKHHVKGLIKMVALKRRCVKSLKMIAQDSKTINMEILQRPQPWKPLRERSKTISSR
jgi:DNA-binding FrmR family transcriptional regulator